jgi:hypothetical protein
LIKELWNWIQSNENYKDKTTLILTTDHGRGKKIHRWKKHGRHIFGSGQMVFAVIGPDTPARGEIRTKGHSKSCSRKLSLHLSALIILTERKLEAEFTE